MKKMVFGFAALAALIATPALAADMALKAPPLAAPTCMWCGVYIGGSIGGAWGTVGVTDVTGLNPPTAPYSINSSAVIGGGEFGYNWQVDQFVFGFADNFGGIGFNSAAPEPSSRSVAFGRFVTTSQIVGGAYGDVTARAGIAWGPTLFYAKGGFAFYDAPASVTNTGSFGGGTATSPTFVGWTGGGGIEYIFAPSWGAKIEYLHFDFGSESATLITPLHGNFIFSNRLTAETVQVGVNYHFH